jgi:hypothetical protein
MTNPPLPEDWKHVVAAMEARDRAFSVATAAREKACAAADSHWCPAPLYWLGLKRCSDAAVHREVALIYKHYASALADCDGVDDNIGWQHAPGWVNVDRCQHVVAAFKDFHANPTYSRGTNYPQEY